MNPALKRFNKRYLPIADAIAYLDLDQQDREAVAKAISESIQEADEAEHRDFKPDLFVLLASDPLVDCAGHHGEPCPHGRVIRIAMHNRDDPDGRSAAWRQHAPYGSIRCVSCGAAEFIPGYSEV